MRRAHPGFVISMVVASALIIAFGTPTLAKQDRPANRVWLVKPFVQASIADKSSMLAYKFDALAKLDPDHPAAYEGAGQTLSLFGREDLIAASSGDYAPTQCGPVSTATDVLTEIERRARSTSVVIINESHERSQHRAFIVDVARRLRPLGYDTLAIEALANAPLGTPDRYLPTFVRRPDLPYFEDEDGFYLSEAAFGRLGRLAKGLGFRLLPYEHNDESAPGRTMTREEQIAEREEGQARNLAAFLRSHPAAKLLVHVGYSHAAEVPRHDGTRWMAARLKERTGIDPLTISQTSCRGGGDTPRLSVLPADEPAGTFDLIVDHPTGRFERHRPEWRRRAGDQAVSIPRPLRPAAGWRVVEARPVGEPAASVPMDRVAIRPGEDVPLMLPPGRYSLRFIDPAGVGMKPSPPAN